LGIWSSALVRHFLDLDAWNRNETKSLTQAYQQRTTHRARQRMKRVV